MRLLRAMLRALVALSAVPGASCAGGGGGGGGGGPAAPSDTTRQDWLNVHPDWVKKHEEDMLCERCSAWDRDYNDRSLTAACRICAESPPPPPRPPPPYRTPYPCPPPAPQPPPPRPKDCDDFCGPSQRHTQRTTHTPC